MPSLKYLLTSVTLAIGLSSSYAAMAKVELVQPNPNINVIKQNNDANLKDIWARNERDYRQDRRYSHYDDRDSWEERHQARRNERRSSLDKGPYRTSGGFLTGSYGGAGYLDNSTGNNRRGKTTYRDANGLRVGSAYNNGYGQTVYRDKNGRRVGSATNNNHGGTVYRDKYGRKVGSATTDSRGNTVYRDKYGRKVGSSSTSAYGRTTYKDDKGRRVGSSRTDSNGRTEYRDAHGRRVGSAR